MATLPKGCGVASMEIKASPSRHHETSKGGRGDPGDNLKGYRIVLEVFFVTILDCNAKLCFARNDGFYLRAGKAGAYLATWPSSHNAS